MNAIAEPCPKSALSKPAEYDRNAGVSVVLPGAP